jgi:hypothetical protein
MFAQRPGDAPSGLICARAITGFPRRLLSRPVVVDGRASPTDMDKGHRCRTPRTLSNSFFFFL